MFPSRAELYHDLLDGASLSASPADLYSYFVGQLPAGARKKSVLVVINVDMQLKYDF